MSPVLSRIIKEPLSHFLLIGLLLFGLFAVVNRDAAGPGNRIEISRADIEQLQALFQRQWQRPPSPQELQALVDGRVREEVLYREAVALGLDRDDTIVRRRLAQKVEFLVADSAVPTEPDEATLKQYYEKNQERYREPARLSFVHVYFRPDKRGERAVPDAEAALKRLTHSKRPLARAPEEGDRFMLASEYADRGLDEITREFGQEFADALGKLPSGQWQGPVTSGYGLHLVYVRARVESRVPALAQVRERVVNDWLIDQRREANERVFERLRARYQVIIADVPGMRTAQALTP